MRYKLLVLAIFCSPHPMLNKKNNIKEILFITSYLVIIVSNCYWKFGSPQAEIRTTSRALGNLFFGVTVCTTGNTIAARVQNICYHHSNQPQVHSELLLAIVLSPFQTNTNIESIIRIIWVLIFDLWLITLLFFKINNK